MTLFNALIRTHHVTSRKKVARLRKAAHKHLTHVVIRSGGAPGLMYAEGLEPGVSEWVSSVQGLRYKDYQLVRKPAPVGASGWKGTEGVLSGKGFEEVESVGAFAGEMEKRGILEWWRSAMGYGEAG